MRRQPLDLSERDGYGEPDPAEVMTGAEYDSRMKLKAMSAKGRQELIDDAASGRVRYPEWLAEHLGLCPRCQKPNIEMERRYCELCATWVNDEGEPI